MVIPWPTSECGHPCMRSFSPSVSAAPGAGALPAAAAAESTQPRLPWRLDDRTNTQQQHQSSASAKSSFQETHPTDLSTVIVLRLHVGSYLPSAATYCGCFHRRFSWWPATASGAASSSLATFVGEDPIVLTRLPLPAPEYSTVPTRTIRSLPTHDCSRRKRQHGGRPQQRQAPGTIAFHDRIHLRNREPKTSPAAISEIRFEHRLTRGAC